MKRKVDPFDYAGQIFQNLHPNGMLLTTAADGKVNTMTIGWGTLGYDWSRPVFIAYVRDSRYTREMLEKNGEFTVNVPMGDADKNILRICGTKSGRDTDKIDEAGLTLVESDVVSVPGIAQFPLTLECKVIYVEEQDPARQPGDIVQNYYPSGGHHTALYGQIVNAYLIEN